MMHFSTCLNHQKSPARRTQSRSVVIDALGRIPLKSIDTDSIVNTIREPKILTIPRMENADKGL